MNDNLLKILHSCLLSDTEHHLLAIAKYLVHEVSGKGVLELIDNVVCVVNIYINCEMD